MTAATQRYLRASATWLIATAASASIPTRAQNRRGILKERALLARHLTADTDAIWRVEVTGAQGQALLACVRETPWGFGLLQRGTVPGMTIRLATTYSVNPLTARIDVLYGWARLAPTVAVTVKAAGDGVIP